MLDFNLVWWDPLVHFLMGGLRLFAEPFVGILPPGIAAGLAIILFTLAIRLILLPLSLQQVRSQKAQMAIQPELKVLQKKYKGDREGMARAQMELYKERGINPAAGCLPLLIQMPILFAMYSAMLQLSTIGLTLDNVQARQVNNQAGTITYQASRSETPFPRNQFILFTTDVTPKGSGPVTLDIPQDQAQVSDQGADMLSGTESLTLTPGQAPPNPNPPNTPSNKASFFIRPVDHNKVVQADQPYPVQVEVNANQTRADSAKVVVTFDPSAASVSDPQTPPLTDIPFKSEFFWLPSLGEPDLFHIAGLGVPGLLLILMTISSFISQRMTTLPSTDPQQQAMMRSMAFMPLMYLFFFLQTPAGLVLYWLTSNVFTMFQQYFTTGLGMLGGDLRRFTGRDLQPAWAHVPGGAPASTLRALGEEPETGPDGRNGHAAADKTPVPAVGGAGPRRARPGGGKGRKRGKR